MMHSIILLLTCLTLSIASIVPTFDPTPSSSYCDDTHCQVTFVLRYNCSNTFLPTRVDTVVLKYHGLVMNPEMEEIAHIRSITRNTPKASFRALQGVPYVLEAWTKLGDGGLHVTTVEVVG